MRRRRVSMVPAAGRSAVSGSGKMSLMEELALRLDERRRNSAGGCSSGDNDTGGSGNGNNNTAVTMAAAATCATTQTTAGSGGGSASTGHTRMAPSQRASDGSDGQLSGCSPRAAPSSPSALPSSPSPAAFAAAASASPRMEAANSGATLGGPPPGVAGRRPFSELVAKVTSPTAQRTNATNSTTAAAAATARVKAGGLAVVSDGPAGRLVVDAGTLGLLAAIQARAKKRHK